MTRIVSIVSSGGLTHKFQPEVSPKRRWLRAGYMAYLVHSVGNVCERIPIGWFPTESEALGELDYRLDEMFPMDDVSLKKPASGPWFSEYRCEACEQALSWWQVMHLQGVCPLCGNANNGTVVRVYTVPYRLVPQKRWWQFWIKQTREYKDE